MRTVILTFVQSSFRSVWALELMLFLQRSDRAWKSDELVTELRASQVVVDQSMADLLAAGFVFVDGDQRIHYGPANAEIDRMARETAQLYRQQPDRVRRAIVSRSENQLNILAEAFRFKGADQ
jgi:hypothetical protein